MRRFAAIALLLVAACKAEPPATTTTAAAPPATVKPPSIAEAQTLIANSAELGEFEFTKAGWTVPVSGKMMSAPARAEAHDLASAGWVAFDGAGDLMLTDKARNDKRFLMRENGLLDVVPLAKKEMGSVTAVRLKPDNTASADFTWKWIPNEVGASFRKGAVHDRFAEPRRSRATLIWDGTSWSVLKIE